MRPNQIHQLDFVGPCYLTVPTRFYSLNAIDPAINRCGIEPIPSRSAQVVEKFNDHLRQKFLGKITMTSMMELRQESLAFEHRHNSTYRYSKIKGKTPFKAWACTENKLAFPSKTDVPRHPFSNTISGVLFTWHLHQSDFPQILKTGDLASLYF